MRVATNMTYLLSQARLGRNMSNISDANTVVSTGKRINSIADDPVGLSYVMGLNSSISNMDQLGMNIATGRRWLDGGESALSSIVDAIDQAKVLSISMNNGIFTEEDRKSAAMEIEGVLDQVLDLSNTIVNGNYIFSGSMTDQVSFKYDNESNPSKVLYGGDDRPFSIKTGDNFNITVGFNGEDIFTESTIKITDANNKIDFREDPTGAFAYGADLTAEIPHGTYTPDELALAIESALTSRSAAAGQREIMNINPGGSDANIVVDNYSALTTETAVGVPVNLAYGGPTNGWTVTGVPAAYTTGMVVMSESTDSEVLLDLNDDNSADIRIKLDSPYTAGDFVDFEISLPGGNAIDYGVGYDEGTKLFSIYEEPGAGPGSPLDTIEFLWNSGENNGASIGTELGYDYTADTAVAAVDFDINAPYSSDEEVEWGLFNTLIDLKKYLETDDSDGLNRTIGRLNDDLAHITTYISETGIRDNRLDVRENSIEDLKLSLNENRMEIEDADIIEAISNFQAQFTAYEAALSSTSKILDLSLLKYL